MQQYEPGYFMHVAHAQQLAEAPWGWRAATIASVNGQHVSADYLTESGTVWLWHALSLAGDVEVGLPVRVHEEHHCLEVDDAWINVRIDSGIGTVPLPEHPELWSGELYGVLINAATGQGMRIPADMLRGLRYKA